MSAETKVPRQIITVKGSNTSWPLQMAELINQQIEQTNIEQFCQVKQIGEYI